LKSVHPERLNEMKEKQQHKWSDDISEDIEKWLTTQYSHMSIIEVRPAIKQLASRIEKELLKQDCWSK